jgi:hypothetical protein
MDVIFHQTIGPDFHTGLMAMRAHELKIFLVVLRPKKRGLSAVSPLDDVMGNSWDYYACKSSHNVPLQDRSIADKKNSILSPDSPDSRQNPDFRKMDLVRRKVFTLNILSSLQTAILRLRQVWVWAGEKFGTTLMITDTRIKRS